MQTADEKWERSNLILNVHFYKERFLVKDDNQLHAIASADIAYFFAKAGHVYIQTKQGPTYKYNDTLYGIAKQVNPKRFYLVNRSVMVAYESIAGIECADHRLYLRLSPAPEEEVVVSRERVSAFREWLEL